MELNQLLCVYSLNARMYFNRGHKWGGDMQLILALAIYSFGLLTGALCVAFFEGAGRGRLSDAPQTRQKQPSHW